MYSKKHLKTHLLSALKFGKVVDNKARFVWIEKEKMKIRMRKESSCICIFFKYIVKMLQNRYPVKTLSCTITILFFFFLLRKKKGSNISKNANTLLKRTLWRVCRHAHYSKVGCVIIRGPASRARLAQNDNAKYAKKRGKCSKSHLLVLRIKIGKKSSCSKSHLFYVQKVKKGLDKNAQFEL